MVKDYQKHQKTPLGKELMKIRVDNNESQKDMAKKLNISTSYLSSIENGLKNPPSNCCEKIIKYYDLTENQKIKLKKSFILSTKLIFPHPYQMTENELELLSYLIDIEYRRIIANYFANHKKDIGVE